MKFLHALTGVVLGLLTFGLGIHPVYADPHAMFYTTVGQQQLFFNMLGALDQADYVEPATNTLGTSSGNSRDELLKNRKDAGFSEETAPYVTKTHTDLSSVLTRNITLEGNDLWTAYRAYLDALEADRRRNLKELLEIFCSIAIGVKDCDEVKSERRHVAEARKERSYNVDPINEAKSVDDAADAALIPAVAPAFAQQEAQRLLLQASLEHNNFRPFDENAAELGKRTAGNPTRQGILDRWVAAVTNFTTGSINTTALDPIDNNGHVVLPNDATASDLTQKLSAYLNAPNQILGSHINAEEQRQTIDAVKNKNGLLTQTYPVPRAENGQLTRIDEKLTKPVIVNEAQINTAAQTIADAEVTRYDVTTEQNIQGTVELTEDDAGKEDEEKVAGVTTGSQVLGLTDDLGAEGEGVEDPEGVGEERDPRDLIDVALGPTSFSREPIPEKVLILFAGGRKSGGCGCSLDDVLSSYGTGVTGG